MIDKYLDRRYDRKNYNCAHLVCEAWKDLTGIDLSESLQGVLTSKMERMVGRKAFTGFRRLEKPETPCIVLMNPTGHREPHVGIYYKKKILHITSIGVMFQWPELATMGYKTVRYYTC